MRSHRGKLILHKKFRLAPRRGGGQPSGVEENAGSGPAGTPEVRRQPKRGDPMGRRPIVAIWQSPATTSSSIGGDLPRIEPNPADRQFRPDSRKFSNLPCLAIPRYPGPALGLRIRVRGL